jgi:predicted nucleic acid-binding protein
VALVVLDASVLIAFLDAADTHHVTAVAAISGERDADYVLPASAYAEALVRPFARGASAVRVIDEFLAELGIRIQPLDAETARQAARLRARHRGLRLPDALVLATADMLDASAVLTADRAWLRYSRRARPI